jgi:alpha-L-rhamnosidase
VSDRTTPSPTEWTARWIEPDEPPGGVDVHRPAYHLVGTIDVADPASAALRITAHGLYEAFVNGQRVGDHELTPGFTAYRKRLQVQSYDVSDLVRRGENVVGVRLSDGWWRGQNNVSRFSNCFGATVGVLAELAIVGADGTEALLVTDERWHWSPSHILAADLIAGETHDLRLLDPGWASPGVDRSAWAPVRPGDHGFDALCDTIGPPVRRVAELRAVSVAEVRPGRHLVDFGQNSNGWIRLTDLGPAGTTLSIVHGEALTPAGDDVDIDAVAGEAFGREGGQPVGFQTDVVISAGPGSVFEPRHSTKGFRYVRIDGHPGPLDPASIASVVVHSDVPDRGGFTCSDEDLNRLHRAADWSLRTNLCDIPMDCPTRERAGWTGDWQIYVGTAAYLYDVTDLSTKWLLDAGADQLESGAITHFTPEPADLSSPRAAWWRELQGSAGWGDAIVHVPWELYLATGDPQVLAPHVDAMCRWVDFAAGLAASGRHPDRAAARPEAAAHEVFLWDTGFHFGEWNEPGAEEGQIDRIRVMDHGPTATAFLHRSARELSAIAGILGRDELAVRYRALADGARDAWQREFLDPDGRVVPANQANVVRALAFGLVPDPLVQQAVDQLAGLVAEAGGHLGTGFLATPFLLPVLADHGRLDLAYELLLQRTPPSWLAMIDQGATTIWESWVPFRADGRVACSLNHFSMGSVISFLHRYTAGLQIVEPGYRRFRVAPRPGGGLTRASTHHDSPHGRISVGWERDGEVYRVEVTVPPGTEADLILPTGGAERLGPGHHERKWG